MCKRIQIIIGADFVPTETNTKLFSEGNIQELLGEGLLRLFDECEYKIFNLEMPLYDGVSPIVKRGPNLVAKTSTINAYKSLGVDLFTLANNHILDQGEKGLHSTFNVLDQKGIQYIGAGSNINNIRKSTILECGRKKVGVYACCENEFSVATTMHGGANPFDVFTTFDEICELKSRCDFVIILYHGGKEHYRYPSPRLQKICRKFVDSGSDLVLCQHSHCIGAREVYSGAEIIYGQGNFLFDHNESEYWKTGLLVTLDENLKVAYVPVQKMNERVRLATGTTEKEIFTSYETRSNEIAQNGFIETHYAAYSREAVSYYLRLLSGVTKKNIVFHTLNKITRGKWEKSYVQRKYNQDALIALQNIIECEAHNELLLAGIKEMRKQNE